MSRTKKKENASFQERLLNLSPYKAEFKTYGADDKYWVVSVTYPENWSSIEPLKDSGIKMENDKNVHDIYYYIAPMQTDVNEIFDLIDSTIQYNKEIEEKVELLNKKIDELTNLFSNEDIDTLRTIEFKVRRKRGGQKNNKNAAKKPIELVDTEKKEEPAPTPVANEEETPVVEHTDPVTNTTGELSEEELAKRFS